MQVWRCCKRPGLAHVFFRLCVGRRRRRQLLDPRPLWKLGRHAAAAGLVAGEYLLPQSVSAGADVARAREFTLNRVPGNGTLNANLNLNINAIGNLGLVVPAYTFATPVLGGQASVSLMAAYGVVGTSLAGTLSGVATVPPFGSRPFGPLTENISDTTWGFGDLAPMFQLKWNAAARQTMGIHRP